MSNNLSSMKLGKRPQRRDIRTLKLARYLPGAQQAQPLQPPASVDYAHGIEDWEMMLNDRLGCCTISAIGHAVQTWTANALGRELTVPDSTILEYYEKWDGYNPADPATDQGGVELDVLNDWRQGKFDGHSLDAYVSIALGDSSELENPEMGRSSVLPVPQIATAIWLFGGAYIGVELPIRAQTQDVWDVPDYPGPDDKPGSWGGHAVYLVGYDFELPIVDFRLSVEKPNVDPQLSVGSGESAIDRRQSTMTCITWGKPKQMPFAWFEKYCSEAYALVSKDWLRSNGVAPNGFDLATLESDLEAVSGQSSAVRSRLAAN